MIPAAARERRKRLDSRRIESNNAPGPEAGMSKLFITILCIVGEIAVVAAGFILYLMYA